MTRPPLFVELCAGTAALSLRLHSGRHARPPVARMGSKAGYANVILECLGLYPGQGADAYLWCEPDPGCRLMLCAYGDPEVRAQAAAIIRSWAGEEGVVDSGFVGPGDRQDTTATAVAVAVATASPALVVGAAIEPFTVADGTITYIDPPYLNTTGYASDLPRSEVVRLARAWAAAGAWVVVSEAEPIPDLLGDGWHAVEITAGRVGSTRNFSRQQREWLTMSRAPTWRPSDQASLFGGGS